jgi:hypothetical protein
MAGDDRPLIYLGVDIGKSAHYAVGVDRDGRTVYSKPVANDESTLRLLVLWARAHQAAVIVDQPGGTAALLLKLCWDATIEIGYVPGLAMARARDFYAGDSKTDPKDAFVLADIGRAHSGRVVWLQETTSDRAELELLNSYDGDLRGDANRLTNRLRALLATYWPALERALGDRLDTIGATALLMRYPGVPQLRHSCAMRYPMTVFGHHRLDTRSYDDGRRSLLLRIH